MAKFYNMMTGKEEIEMTSLEIAEVTGKRHDNVKRDIRNLLARLGKDPRKFEDIYVDGMNREQTVYKLNKRDTMNLLMGYSPKLRDKGLEHIENLEGEIEDLTLNSTNPNLERLKRTPKGKKDLYSTSTKNLR